MGEGVRALWAYVPSNGVAAFAFASVFGAFTIVLLALCYAIYAEGWVIGFGFNGWDAIFLACIYVPIFTLFATPFVALGLALFGVPVALMARRYYRSAMLLPLALVWGFISAVLIVGVLDGMARAIDRPVSFFQILYLVL